MLQVAEDAVRLEGMAGLDIQEILLCLGRTLKYKLAYILCISGVVNVCGVLTFKGRTSKKASIKNTYCLLTCMQTGGGETQTPALFYFVFSPLHIREWNLTGLLRGGY